MSVVITMYNTGQYLPETLESVFAQRDQPYEVIVVDDGSTDDSVGRAREFGDRIRLITRPHEGIGPARNAGIASATGDYLAFLDSDDLWEPETLRVQVDVARRHPTSGLIVADGVSFGAPPVEGRRLYNDAVQNLFGDPTDDEVTGSFHREFVAGNLVACPAQTLLPRWAFEAVGPVCDRPNGAQDYDYYLRVTRSFPATFHRASLARWRFRADSMSGDTDERSLRWLRWNVELLARERHQVGASAASYVDAALRAQTRRAAGIARHAYLHGTVPDPGDLAALYHAQPWNPYLLSTRATLAFPPAAGRAAARVARSCAQVIARVRHRSR